MPGKIFKEKEKKKKKPWRFFERNLKVYIIIFPLGSSFFSPKEPEAAPWKVQKWPFLSSSPQSAIFRATDPTKHPRSLQPQLGGLLAFPLAPRSSVEPVADPVLRVQIRQQTLSEGTRGRLILLAKACEFVLFITRSGEWIPRKSKMFQKIDFLYQDRFGDQLTKGDGKAGWVSQEVAVGTSPTHKTA